MRLIKTMVDVGAIKPFKLAHFSDLHLTLVDGRDDDTNILHAEERLRQNRWEFKNAVYNYAYIMEYVKENPDTQLVCTGDMFDFITERNLEAAKTMMDETGCFFAVGNHEFHNVEMHRGAKETPEYKATVYDRVQKYFNNDLEFAKKEINGVNLVAIDNSFHQMNKIQLQQLKMVVAEGKPIILLVHVPLYNEAIREATRRYLYDQHKLNRPSPFMGAPESAARFYNEYIDVYEQSKPNEETKEAHEYIVNEKLIKCILTGHLHFDFETMLGNKMQLMTGVDTLREIMIY